MVVLFHISSEGFHVPTQQSTPSTTLPNPIHLDKESFQLIRVKGYPSLFLPSFSLDVVGSEVAIRVELCGEEVADDQRIVLKEGLSSVLFSPPSSSPIPTSPVSPSSSKISHEDEGVCV